MVEQVHVASAPPSRPRSRLRRAINHGQRHRVEVHVVITAPNRNRVLAGIAAKQGGEPERAMPIEMRSDGAGQPSDQDGESPFGVTWSSPGNLARANGMMVTIVRTER